MPMESDPESWSAARAWLRVALGAAFAVVVGGVAGCSALDDVDGFSPEEWKDVLELEPLAKPMPPSLFNNRYNDPKLARFGQKLFFETELAEAIKVPGPSGNVGDTGKIGCITCHDTKYFTDSRPLLLSQGADHIEQHNTPTLANVAWWDWYLWMGLFDSLMMHGCFGTLQEATPLAYAHYVYKKYRAEYEDLFPNDLLDPALDPAAPDAARFPPSGAPGFPGAPPGPYEMMTVEDQMYIDKLRTNIARAFDAYPRHLVTRNSPFEKYIHGDHDALAPAQKRGLRLFIGKAACNDCHYGPLLSDQKFHNIGVPTPLGQMPDPGRAGVLPFQILPAFGPGSFNTFNGAGPYSDDPELGAKRIKALDDNNCKPHTAMEPCVPKDEVVGTFRTAMLLNIAETAPYFHTGEAQTLEDVVRHYNQGGGPLGSYAGTKSPRLRPLGLSDGEIGDLVAFLNSLTGEFEEPDFACDPHKPGCLAGM